MQGVQPGCSRFLVWCLQKNENTSQIHKCWCLERKLSSCPSGLAGAEPKTDVCHLKSLKGSWGHQGSNAHQGLGIMAVCEDWVLPPCGFHVHEM